MLRLFWWALVLVALAGCSALSESTSKTPIAASPAQASPQPAPSATSAPTPTTATATPQPTSTATASPLPTATASVIPTLEPAWSYPIGVAERPLGDGFFIRHGYTVENTWYNPGYWHTGEDWYALEGDTAGAGVYAVAAGEVVYAGSNYPGRVVIVRHADELFSMYAHLDPALAVELGQPVARGTLLGRVLRRNDDVPNHLHFEIRAFLTTPAVNGDTPRYGFRCGADCPPGPGYWPVAAPDLPTALGWRNPTHVIARRMFVPEAQGPLGEVVSATQPISPSVTLWAEIPEDGRPRAALGDVQLQPGARFPLLEVQSGPEAPEATSARAYRLWYRVRLPDGREGWIEAAVASTFETGSDGRPSTTRFNLYPAIGAR